MTPKELVINTNGRNTYFHSNGVLLYFSEIKDNKQENKRVQLVDNIKNYKPKTVSSTFVCIYFLIDVMNRVGSLSLRSKPDLL